MATLRRQLNRFKFLIFILLIVIAALVFLLARNRQPSALPTTSLETVQARDVIQHVNVEGNLEAVSKRSVNILAGAKVTEVVVSIGQVVAKDQKLARVETVVNNRTVGSDILAPAAGTITALNIYVGDLVAATSNPAFVIEDLSSYVIELQVNENDIPDLKTGQTASLLFPAISLDETYPATVDSISPAPATTSGAVNYAVVVKPSTLPEQVKLGMSVDVQITTNRVDNVVAVPESFLIEKDDKSYVKVFTWKTEDQLEYDLTETEVTTGLITDEYAEIKSGVKAGDQIVEPTFTQQRRFGFF